MNTQNTTVKTIDIQAKEWFDIVNGNSYFAALVTINFGMPDEKSILAPFQYGYEEHYKDVCFSLVCKEYSIDTDEHYLRYCQNNGIEFNASKQKNCKKSELKNI